MPEAKGTSFLYYFLQKREKVRIWGAGHTAQKAVWIWRQRLLLQTPYKLLHDFVEVFWSERLIFVPFYEYNLRRDTLKYHACSVPSCGKKGRQKGNETSALRLAFSAVVRLLFVHKILER